MAGPDYINRYGAPAAPETLDGHLMVGYAASATGQAYPLEFCTGNGKIDATPPHSILVRGAEIYTASALAGLGLIQVPRYRVAHRIESGDLVEC